jgi:predicted amidophosphoribosyltransferase
MTRVLQKIRETPPLDIRELIIQKTSTAAAHHSDTRPRPETLEPLYEINPPLKLPEPKVIGLFDDVLTTGAHFKAAQSLLNSNCSLPLPQPPLLIPGQPIPSNLCLTS